MKKVFSTLFALIFMICFSFSLTSCAPKNTIVDKLVIYNWSEYIYDYEEDFKDYYKNITGNDIEITYVTFDTNETMMTKITKGDSKIDVMCPSEYTIQKLMQMDMLVPLNYFSEENYLDKEKLLYSENYTHNSDNIDENIRAKIENGFCDIECKKSNGETYSANMIDYMVPYMYGTLGILYNKEKFKELGIYDYDVLNQANWGILFNDSGEDDSDGNDIMLSDGLSGSILMKNSIRDTYAATLFYLVESGKLGEEYLSIPVNELINMVDDNILSACKDALINQKNQLFGYEVDFGKDDLLQGNAYVDLAWSGDALYAFEESWNDEIEDYELSYYVPHTTGNIWFDGWVIPKTYDKSHETAIKLFINFLTTPYVAVQNMLEIGYTSAVSAELIKNDEEAMEILYEGYNVNVSGDEDGDYDYGSKEEFIKYFFENSYEEEDEYGNIVTLSYDEIGGANWRYPFMSSGEALGDNDEYKRLSSDLGVMRDFGDKNKDVITLWNYARSVGMSAFPIFAVVILSIAFVLGIIILCWYIGYRRKLRVKL